MFANHLMQLFLICEGRRVEVDLAVGETRALLGVRQQVARVDAGGVPLQVTVTEEPEGGWRVAVAHGGTTIIEELFVGVEVPLALGDASYTLIPGVYYNGNKSERTKAIPAMTAAQQWRVEVQAAACSIPVLLHADGQGEGLLLRGSPFTRAGSSGYYVDGARGLAGFVAPALEARRYTHGGWLERRRLGWRLEPQQVLTFQVECQTFPCAGVSELFQRLNHDYREVPGYPAPASAPMTLDDAVQRISDFLLRVHYQHGAGNEPMLLNATLDPAQPYTPDGWNLDWNQIVGWCGGAMTAFPLLLRGGTAREAACANLDFLAQGGVTPSGLKAAIFDGRKWLGPNPRGAEPWEWYHVRMPADHITYLLKAAQWEAAQGRRHDAWFDDARRGLDAFCALWEQYDDFGFYVDPYQHPAVMLESGSCAGAFPLLALATGMRAFPEETRYRNVYRAAATHYHAQFAACGHCTGGPLDILRADDSESAAALTDALTQGYLLLREPALLAMALDAANLFASWVVSYAAPFPPASSLHGRNPRGGVLANVQNRHVGPGIATNSARFLYELGEASGDPCWHALYREVLTAPLNFVCPRTGAFLGYDRASGDTLPFMEGMVSEQINLTDALNEPGEMWRVSASWPATVVLLSWAERPESVDI